jgi:hypothetical protein
VFKWNFPLGATTGGRRRDRAGIGKREGGMDKLKGKKIAWSTTTAPTARNHSAAEGRAQKHGFS